MQAYDIKTNDKDRDGNHFFIMFLSDHEDLFALVKELQSKSIVYGYRAHYNLMDDDGRRVMHVNRVDPIGMSVAKVYEIKNARFPVTIEEGLLP